MRIKYWFHLFKIAILFINAYRKAAGRPVLTYYCIDCHMCYMDVLYEYDKNNPIMCNQCRDTFTSMAQEDSEGIYMKVVIH